MKFVKDNSVFIFSPPTYNSPKIVQYLNKFAIFYRNLYFLVQKCKKFHESNVNKIY